MLVWFSFVFLVELTTRARNIIQSGHSLFLIDLWFGLILLFRDSSYQIQTVSPIADRSVQSEQSA